MNFENFEIKAGKNHPDKQLRRALVADVTLLLESPHESHEWSTVKIRQVLGQSDLPHQRNNSGGMVILAPFHTYQQLTTNNYRAAWQESINTFAQEQDLPLCLRIGYNRKTVDAYHMFGAGNALGHVPVTIFTKEYFTLFDTPEQLVCSQLQDACAFTGLTGSGTAGTLLDAFIAGDAYVPTSKIHCGESAIDEVLFLEETAGIVKLRYFTVARRYLR